MDKDILERIEGEQAGFSKGQKLIAKYIADNYDKAAFMTAGRLGKTVGVSESTVVRFAAELGYSGYPGMRKALQDMIRSRLTSVQRIEVARERISYGNVLRAVLESDMEKIQATLEEVDQGSFDLAIDTIMGADRIYILGMRSSATLAGFMGFYLNLILENVHTIQDSNMNEAFEQLIRIKPEDVFIGISYPRYSNRTLKAMSFAKDSGAKVIGITDGKTSPLMRVSDIALFAKSDMVSFLDSLVAPMSMINALIAAIGFRTNDSISETFNRLEQVWTEYGVYEYTQD